MEMGISNYQVPGALWTYLMTTTAIVADKVTVQRATQLLTEWSKVFPDEDTWVRRNAGVPSLFVRLDFAPEANTLGLFEVEERPAGIGLAHSLNPDFTFRFNRLSATWPGFKVVMSEKREKGGDDHMWRDVISPDQVNGDLLLIRAEPEEKEYHRFMPRSISTVARKGDKTYGEKLGLWRRVQRGYTLPRDQGFALKPIQGSKCRGVHIVPPRGCKISGGSTMTAANRELEAQGEMFLQGWIPPLTMDINGLEYNAIWRLFFGYNLREQRWEAMGGVWNARRNTLRIHGASDTIFGPLVVED